MIAGVLLATLSPAALAGQATPPGDEAKQASRRAAMVAEHIAARGVTDPLVLAAMKRVPRHLFVPPGLAGAAYADHPLPIGGGQTISQPYIVAYMTELLGLKGGEKVLEIGTGSGYQAAVLAEIAGRVYTIEIVPSLAQEAARRLAALGYRNIETRAGDGYQGWPAAAPFDAIILTAAAPQIPDALVEQLAPGGRLVAPVGPPGGLQFLDLLVKDAQGRFTVRRLEPVVFVPMTGGEVR
ncbi:MAG: protein-L-isoaspartate(D-aspartate) O-methyltransferase [Deltaproteobacteria bacterium]|nr:protein-L-isoaspartate(D-aspartate) O-methyltransferase [Deltaproteobacteria bacterium]